MAVATVPTTVEQKSKLLPDLKTKVPSKGRVDTKIPNIVGGSDSDSESKSVASTLSYNTTKEADAKSSPSTGIVVKQAKAAKGEPVSKESIENRPLPTARELSKVLCRIVDDEVYSDTDREIALMTLKRWASKQNVAFGNHFADVGGLQQVLFFTEDNIDDCRCIAPALMLLVTLCKPMLGVSDTIYEFKELTTMRTKTAKCIVDVNGVDLMLKTFQWHATDKRDETSKDNDKLPVVEDSSIMDNFCKGFIFQCGKQEGPDPRQLEEERKIRRIFTARHSLEVLHLLIPHAIGINNDAPVEIIETLCEALPMLIEKEKRSTQKHIESLVATLMTCLVAVCVLASKDTLTGTSLARAKKLVSSTNLAMRNYPTNQGINRDGCLALQRVCKHLPKSERKRLGVVASLGAVVASESMDQDVKDIADEILEEQFK